MYGENVVFLDNEFKCKSFKDIASTGTCWHCGMKEDAHVSFDIEAEEDHYQRVIQEEEDIEDYLLSDGSRVSVVAGKGITLIVSRSLSKEEVKKQIEAKIDWKVSNVVMRDALLSAIHIERDGAHKILYRFSYDSYTITISEKD